MSRFLANLALYLPDDSSTVTPGMADFSEEKLDYILRSFY